jgi:hypothetical protein
MTFYDPVSTKTRSGPYKCVRIRAEKVIIERIPENNEREKSMGKRKLRLNGSAIGNRQAYWQY